MIGPKRKRLTAGMLQDLLVNMIAWSKKQMLTVSIIGYELPNYYSLTRASRMNDTSSIFVSKYLRRAVVGFLIMRIKLHAL